MEITKVRKIGFFSALSICFTSIVGIGIFLKNSSIGNNLQGNGVSWLITWMLSGLLAGLLAFHFGKISRIESKQNLTGLSSWATEIIDEKNNWFKKIVTTNYGLFYNPILSITLSFFCAEFFFEFLKTINENLVFDLWVYIVSTILLSTFFILNNYFSSKISGYISLVTSILKFIPLLMVILIGIIFWNSHNNNSSNGFENIITPEKALQGIMLSMPSTLFAFDSFIGVGSWSKEIKGGPKAISKVIVISISFVTIVYCLICLASIFHYNSAGTTIVSVLIDSLPKGSEKWITIFVTLFIFISAFGTTNSIVGTMLNEYKNILIGKKILFSANILNKYNVSKGALILTFFFFGLWSLILFVPTLIINTDALLDGFSNLVVVYIFLIYAYLIYQFWKNIYKKEEAIKSKKIKNNIYSTLVWISLIGTIMISLLNFYYVLQQAILEPMNQSSWGLYLIGKNFGSLNNLDALIIYIVFTFAFFSTPFINDILVNKKNKVKF